MANKTYLDQEGLERLVQYINDALRGKANVGDIPADVVLKDDLAEYVKTDDLGAYIDEDELTNELSAYATNASLEDVVREDELLAYATNEALESLRGEVTGVYHYRGSVKNLEALTAIENPSAGDVYNLEDTGMNAAWTGTMWDEFGTIADLSNCLMKDDVDGIPIPTVDAILYGGKSAIVSDIAGVRAMLANDEPEVEITLTENITSNIAIPAGKKVTLDLGGKSARTITANAENSEVVIKNGTVASGSRAAAVAVSNGAKAVIEDGAVITGTSNNGIEVSANGEVVVNGGQVGAQEAGIYTAGNGNLTINGGVISCVDNGGVMANGTAGKGGNTITMNGGRIEGHIKSAGYLACGLYLPNDDVFTMNGGEIISDGAGIVLRGGKAIINAGTVEGRGVSGVAGKVGDSRVVVGPYAIVYDTESSYPAKDSLELVLGPGAHLYGTDGDINVIGGPANITDNRA